MKYITFLCLAILLVAISSPSFSQQSLEAAPKIKEVPVIQLSGNGYQRGLQHGKQLKGAIAEVYRKWKEDITAGTKQNADSVIAQFYRQTDFLPAIKKWTPELYDEIKGIAESSGQSFTDVYCFQMMDEFWVYMDKVQNAEIHHCSVIGVAASGTRPAYIAQNLDGPTFLNGSQVLLHIKAYKDEPEQYLLSAAGLVGMNGINASGIGLTVNTLMQLSAATDGLPVACVVRGVLLRQDKRSALAFLQSVKHASGQNYIVGAVDSVYDYEASATKVVRYLPVAGDPSLVYHTNHPVSNDDVKPWHREGLRKLLAGEVASNSATRFKALQARLDITKPGFSEYTIKETLRSKDSAKSPICLSYDPAKGGFTFSSVIYTLGKKPTVQITNGAPDGAEYILHTFTGSK